MSLRGRASIVIPARVGFEAVSKQFEAVRVLDHIDLTIAEGEVVCLLGPSGCGKSTLLRLAAGIEAPTGGRITLDGREIAGPDRFVPPEERGIGLVFQDYALFPHLTARENVMFGLSDIRQAEKQRIADAALERVGLGGLRDAYPGVLSGGEQQRVALARAIVPRPRVLLMDEPFSNLDRRMRDAVREDTVGLLRETGATALIVTHDPEEAMRIGDRIALMRSGRIVQAGTPEMLYRAPADLMAARFFCEMNEIPGVVRSGRVETPLGTFLAEGLRDGEDCVVCVRPQAIRIRPAGFCLPGRLIARRFLGEFETLDIIAAGHDRPLVARRAAASAPLEPGIEIGIDVALAEALVFPAVCA